NDGNIWVGTDYGLNKIVVGATLAVAQIQKIYKENGLLDSHIESLAIDANGKLWVGTGKGINKVDSIQNTVDSIKYTIIPGKSGPLGNHVLSLATDSTGIYLGTELGLTKYDTSGQWIDYTSQLSGLSNQQITGMTKDSRGYLWLGIKN
ncbi:MAG: hypothetical protein HY934_05825, partial [Candidatus Firestonebacteria bacterium]|nr:hypothetical protein [Candidatus Firestonebacteria bacterium]